MSLLRLIFFLMVCALPMAAQAERLSERHPMGSALQDEARAGVRERQFMPMGRILSDIRQRNPGTLLDAGLEQGAKRPVYHVRWLSNDGRRVDYVVDARTGNILSARGE